MLNSFLLSLACVAAGSAVSAMPNRTWTTYVDMRDGVKLHTRIVVPRDYVDGDKLTIIMDRSPYGQFGIELLDDLFVPAGFIAVGQDMRGTGLSEGRFSNWKADANDSEDLGNWLVQQPWSNGEIYTFGASADGLGAFTTNYNAPSWLSSQYYIWTSSIGYEVIYPNGALLYNLLNRWITGTVRDYDIDKCYGEFMENEAETDWWEDLTFTGNYDLVKKGSFGFWAGWYDIFLVGNLAAYEGYNTEASAGAQHNSVLLIDPCGHCQDAAKYFSEDIIAGRTALGLMQAYATFGSRPVKRNNIKNVTFYVMSSNDDEGKAAGQFWTTMEAFPPATMTPYYLHGDGTAGLEPPETDATPSTSFVYDPTDVIATQGGNNLFSDAPCGPLDQQEIDRRADVLVFETPKASEPLYLTGALNAHLHLSSDAIDTDFMVRISDVYPSGEARLIQDSAVRMRWRNGGTVPQYMEAGQVYPTYVSLWNTSYVVAPGHSLRFALSSSNYPRFSINRNNGALLADEDNYPGDNITAVNTVHHSNTYPSYIELPVVSKRDLPVLHDLKAEFEMSYPNMDYDFVVTHGAEMLDKFMNAERH